MKGSFLNFKLSWLLEIYVPVNQEDLAEKVVDFQLKSKYVSVPRESIKHQSKQIKLGQASL